MKPEPFFAKQSFYAVTGKVAAMQAATELSQSEWQGKADATVRDTMCANILQG